MADNVLLVQPLGYSADDAGRDISRLATVMPPLGLASMAAYMEKRGLETNIVDCYANPASAGVIRDYVATKKPSIVGFSATTANFLDGVELAKMARQVHPDLKIVFGGPHVSALKERVLTEFPEIDFTAIGEGEQTLYELATGGANEPAKVEGIVYRKPDGSAESTGYRGEVLELDEQPFPAYEKLTGFPGTYQLPIFNYPSTPNCSSISSRGCPYSCSYCDRSVFRKSFRFNSAEYLYEHMKYLKDRFRIKHINFYDDQFTFNRKRVAAFTDMMINRPLGMTFNCSVRFDHVDDELMGRLKQAGCWMVSLGVETGDPLLLARHRQNPDLDKLAETIRMIKRHGLRVKGLFMIGLPGETRGSFMRSMDYAFSLPIDEYNLAKFTPFPGSPVYEEIHKMGTFEEDWARMDCMHFQFVPKGMTKEELEELFQLFYKTHFMRARVLWDYTTMAWRSPDSIRRLLMNLGSFIRFARTNKRIRNKG